MHSSFATKRHNCDIWVDLIHQTVKGVKKFHTGLKDMPFLLYVTPALFAASIFLFFWMRWRMRASKGRFALAVVSTMLTCLLSGLSAMSSSLPTAIVSKVFEAIGLGPVQNGAPSYLVLPLTVLAIFYIYRFGTMTIKNWEAPLRVSEIDLAERHLDNSIAALSLEQVKLLFRGQSDPLASDAVANWQDKVSDPPSPVPTHVLLRDMLIEAMNEIRIPDNGWREEGKLWVGEKLGLRSEDTKSILALVFDSQPDLNAVEDRLSSLVKSQGQLEDFDIIALYMSGGSTNNELRTIDAYSKSIRVFSSRELIHMGLELVNYARSIIDLFERTKVGGTDATLKGSYVELNIATNEESGAPETLAKNIVDWLEDGSGKQVAVTGEYGQGKSTGLLKFCYDWAKRFIETQTLNERVPLLIELRGQSPSETDPLGFLSPWCARYRLSPRQIYNLIKSGDAIVIFEGFDELRNAGRAYYRHQHFNALWKFAFPNTKVLFTGRPNFFLDEAEANRTLRNQEARRLGGDLYTEIWKLEKLRPDQIAEACRSYDISVAEGIRSSIRSNEDFFDIVSRPSMLPVVATIWNEIDELRASGNQLTGAALIEKYIQAVFARKEAELEKDQRISNAPVGSRYLILPKQVREFLTICVAWRMSGQRLKNTIPRSEVTEMVREVYEVLLSASKSTGVSPEIAEGMINFEQRFKDESPAERVEAIAAEVCSSGLLVPDPAGGASNLRFPHKQFFEFLVAKAIAIRGHSRSANATRILDRSSPGLTTSARLNGEPNSISYLAECVGPSLTSFASRWQRFSLRVFLEQQIAIYIVIRYVEERTRTQPNDVNGTQDGGLESISERSWALDRIARFMIIGSGPIMIFWFLALLGVGYTEFFVSNLFDNTSEVPAVADETFVSPISTRMRQILPELLGAFMVVSSSLMMATMVRSVSDSSLSKTVLSFLHIHWEKAGELPPSRLSELRATSISLARGRVQFQNQPEDTTDYTRFLYPAPELGDGLQQD